MLAKTLLVFATLALSATAAASKPRHRGASERGPDALGAAHIAANGINEVIVNSDAGLLFEPVVIADAQKSRHEVISNRKAQVVKLQRKKEQLGGFVRRGLLDDLLNGSAETVTVTSVPTGSLQTAPRRSPTSTSALNLPPPSTTLPIAAVTTPSSTVLVATSEELVTTGLVTAPSRSTSTASTSTVTSTANDTSTVISSDTGPSTSTSVVVVMASAEESPTTTSRTVQQTGGALHMAAPCTLFALIATASLWLL